MFGSGRKTQFRVSANVGRCSRSSSRGPCVGRMSTAASPKAHSQSREYDWMRMLMCGRRENSMLVKQHEYDQSTGGEATGASSHGQKRTPFPNCYLKASEERSAGTFT